MKLETLDVTERAAFRFVLGVDKARSNMQYETGRRGARKKCEAAKRSLSRYPRNRQEKKRIMIYAPM